MFIMTRVRMLGTVAAGCIFSVTLFVGTSVPGVSSDCGDVDTSGTVTASDALMVLHRAVGLPVENYCEMVITTTTSTTNSTSGDLCFADDDCEVNYGPGYRCGGPNGYTCVECENNDAHCQPGYVCDGFDCVPDEQ
jgi:hypothetical protein